MSFRSVMLGLSLGVFIAAVTFFNDFVVRQTMLVASHLPIVVFGVVVLFVLLVNPLLRLVGHHTPLRPAEIAVATAVALAACGWPGSGFWRYAATIPSTPVHWYRGTPSWQANGVLSYLPGGPGTLAEGQLPDPASLARRLVADGEGTDGEAGGAGAAVDSGGAGAQFWAALDRPARERLRAFAAQERLPRADVRALLALINAQLPHADLFDPDRLPGDVLPEAGEAPPPATDPHAVTRWNRMVLANAYPGLVLPLPRGSGAVVGGARPDPEVIDTLISGRPGQALMAPEAVPWARWWPTLRLWVGAALLLGLASLCVAMIVHPQWSQRELLPYPIARLVEEIGARREGAALPDIARSRGFWMAMAIVLAIHSVNGLHAWYPAVPTVPLRFNFGTLREIFPNAWRVPQQFGIFTPTLFFSVVGFAFFIPAAASLSLGLAPLLWVMFGSVMLSQGIALDYSRTEPSASNFLRFGAFLAMAVMIFYTGRRYYLDVARGAFGGGHAGTPRYAIWAARALVPLLIAAGLLLHSSGMDAWIVVLLVSVICLSWIVLTRIVCETGMIFISNPFAPAVIVEGLVGFEALGPTGVLLVVMTSWMLIGDPRECLMPYLSNGLAITERAGGGRGAVGRVGPWLAVMVVASMLVSGFVTLSQQYEHGATSMGNDYAARYIPGMGFSRVAHHAAEAAAVDALTDATAATGWERIAAIDPVSGIGIWFLLGFVLVMVTASARLRVPGFPLHPVIFLMWGTYAASYMGFSFFIGWALKTAATRIGGVPAYVALKPVMVGVIAGELLAALLWMLVGAAYYLTTGLSPVWYSIFPG